MGKEEIACPELIRLLRLQRHNFLNHMQVIHGLIQLGQTEKALQYIEDVAKDKEALLDEHVRRTDCCQTVDKAL